MWAVRDKDGICYLFKNKPSLDDRRDEIIMGWLGCFYGDVGVIRDKNVLPEVTFENSPIEVELKIKKL